VTSLGKKYPRNGLKNKLVVWVKKDELYSLRNSWVLGMNVMVVEKYVMRQDCDCMQL
jgi:hypothetical protein